MKNEPISYSNLLIKFIEPLINGLEDEEAFLTKAKIGMIAWNFHVSDSNELPYDKETKEILLKITKNDKEAKDILNSLVMRKQTRFSKYNQFIFRVKIRTKNDGTKTLYVESAPADKIVK